MSPQSAVGSLVFFTSALSTASTLHQVFTRTNRPRALSLNSAPPSPAISPQKSSRGRFRWFKTKRKFTPPPTAVHPHDDDMSSICSESDVYLEKRRTLSVPDLPNWSPMSASHSKFVHTSLDETLQEEDEEFEDWDKMIDAEEKKSSNLFSRRPSLPPIPFSFPPTRGKSEKRRHNRCKSLPQMPMMQELPDSLYQKPTQRESWDAFYVIETPEIPVPEAVEESQIFIRMDMFNILDFDSQIKALETLRQQKRTLTESILPTSRYLGNTLRSHSNTELCYDTLEAKYQRHWEEAEVILDLSDVAQDQTHIFGGNRSTHVIERTPSERHFHVLKNIINAELGNNASKVIHKSKETHDDLVENIINGDDDSDKENKSFDERKRRRERLRISVDMVPCLIGRLKKLREILSENIKELTVLAQQAVEGCGVECIRTDDGNLIAS